MLMIILFLITIYLGLKYVYTYWDRNGFPSLKPQIPMGNMMRVVKQQLSFGEAMTDLYRQTKEPFIGIYLFFRPAILVRDPVLVRQILVDDFQSFHDRGIFNNDKIDSMAGTLFAAPGTQWKMLRHQLTPTFTTGKLKAMFQTILDVGNRLNVHVDRYAEQKAEVEIKDLFTRFSTDIIASVIFGCEVDSINDPNHDFRKIGRKIAQPGFINGLRGVCSFLCPQILEFFHIRGIPSDIRDFMINIVRETIEYREKNNISRKDFMQLLLQLRNTGKVGDDGDWDLKSAKNKILTIDQCAGQVFIFYIAGMETAASTITHCIHELSYNPNTLQKLQNEIDEVLARHNNQITYESLQEMKFLEACFKETQRKYPGLPILNRECTKDYKIQNSKLTIKRGTPIIIPIHGIQNDPEIYENPDEFRPERFYDETNTKQIFLAFGEGPRNCIAFRLGRIMAKVGIVMMLQKYNFEAIGSREIEFDPTAVTMIAKHGIRARITKR